MSEINSLWLIELQKVYKKNSDLSIRLYSTDHPLHQSIIRNKERDVRSIHISIHITFTHVVVFVSFQQQHFNEQLTQLTKCLLIWSLIKKISFFFLSFLLLSFVPTMLCITQKISLFSIPLLWKWLSLWKKFCMWLKNRPR